MSHERDKLYTESVEMYLKEIYLLSREGESAKTGAIADALGVSPPSVTDRLAHLEDRDLVEHEKRKGTTLTDDGEDAARRILRKHCRIERFLVNHLDVSEGFHDEACRLEHAMSDDIADRLDAFVDLPDSCPDCYDHEAQHCSRLFED